MKNLKKGLLGETQNLTDLNKLLSQEMSFIINLYGTEGSGKTFMLKQLDKYVETKTIYVDFNNELKPLEEIITNDCSLYFLDNLDTRFTVDQLKNTFFDLFSKFSKLQIIFTSKNKFFLETLPGINIFSFEVGNRVFSYQDFIHFLRNNHFLQSEIEFPNIILKNLFLFSCYCRNFTHFEDVLESLTDLSQKNKKSITPQQLLEILTQSTLVSKLSRDLVIDTKNINNNDYLFVIRSKDKIEKLRDIILKYYPSEDVLLEVMKNQFNPTFIEETFKQKLSYADKVLNICLSYDPVELLINLLGPRDIIIELNDLKIVEATFASSIENKAKLILKRIGLNILDEPKGIEYFYERFTSNFKLLEEKSYEKLNKEYIIGLGISFYQDMETIFFEMINFYAVYFCGSLSNFLNLYNNEASVKVYQKRLTFGQYISIFIFLNKLSNRDEYQLKFVNLCINEIMPNNILRKIEELSSYRNFFSHHQKVESYEIPYYTYQEKVSKIYPLAVNILESLMELNLFPEIIKIRQIVFDEFGRQLYVATNWKKSEIRFSISNSNINIYSHYYILRKKQNISIDPIIIPRFLDDRKHFFENGESYQKSSQTQLQQGATLISYIEPKDQMKILDVGCGNGLTTIELYKKNPSVTIDAFDLSESMTRMAMQNRDEMEIPREKINFYIMDALKLDTQNTYDLIFSNATLHWVCDSKTMYGKLYYALKNGGKLAVHQGGFGCYRGLHAMAKKAIEELDLKMYYENWIYPIFYPQKYEFENLLHSLNFKDIKVLSLETDGSEYPNLPENFLNAGMLPYINKLPEESLQNKLKNTFLKLCKSQPLDKYTHRLYAFATKEV